MCCWTGNDRRAATRQVQQKLLGVFCSSLVGVAARGREMRCACDRLPVVLEVCAPRFAKPASRFLLVLFLRIVFGHRFFMLARFTRSCRIGLPLDPEVRTPLLLDHMTQLAYEYR